jgi:hypothetical protein
MGRAAPKAHLSPRKGKRWLCDGCRRRRAQRPKPHQLGRAQAYALPRGASRRSRWSSPGLAATPTGFRWSGKGGSPRALDGRGGSPGRRRYGAGLRGLPSGAGRRFCLESCPAQPDSRAGSRGASSARALLLSRLCLERAVEERDDALPLRPHLALLKRACGRPDAAGTETPTDGRLEARTPISEAFIPFPPLRWQVWPESETLGVSPT